MAELVETLDPIFLAHLEALQDLSDANAGAICGGEQRQWMQPPASSWSGDPMDIVGMNDAFDRSTLNHAYKQVVSLSGRQGEAGVVKIQLDYIAALERAFRTRQASSVRCKVHAAARRKGHAASGGLYDSGSGSIALWLNRLLTAAHSDPEA